MAVRFPDWGADFAGLIAGVVILNLVTGPPAFKSALFAAGEAQAVRAAPLASEFALPSARGPASLARKDSMPPIQLIPVISATAWGRLEEAGEEGYPEGSSKSIPETIL